jgi:hypothetical protein
MPIAPAFPSGSSTPAADPLVVVGEIDFTSDITTLDMSAGAGTYTLNDAAGSAKATIIVGTDVSGGAVTYTTLEVSGTDGLQVEVTASASNKNFYMAIELPATSDIDKDCVMLEYVISDMAFGSGSGSCQAQFYLSQANSNRGQPAYGLMIARNSGDSQSEYKTQRNYGGSATRSSAAIVAGAVEAAQHIQIVAQNKGAQIYRDNGTSFTEPYTVTTFAGDTGTRTWGATRPSGNTWTTPYAAHFSYLAGSGDVISFKIKKIRLCKFSPSS